MKNEIDSKFILRVFDKIRLNGESIDSQYMLDGVKGFSDFDGYTLYLEDARVKLSFGFHNQYHLDYEAQAHFDDFQKKLKQIDETY